MKTQIIEEMQVLIVDDEPDICFLLSGILKKKNLDTLVVNNLHDAEKVLQLNHPSLLFLDNRLPDGLGIEFIPYIKDKYPDTKVIMMTAHDSLADQRKAYARGADFFISKPLNRELINLALSKIA